MNQIFIVTDRIIQTHIENIQPMEMPDNGNELIRNENEEKRKKIEEEFGASRWGSSENNELDPEIESLFLDYVLAFEKGWKEAKRISVYEFLEKPAFRRMDELSDAEVSTELERFYEIMDQHQLRLDTICEVADAELYRFITEELFEQEIDDMHIPGMMTNFIYEEFHPNHEYDIRHHSTDFIQTYLKKESSYYTNFLSENANKQDWHKHFREAFSSFELRQFEILNMQFDLEKSQAKVDFECDIIAEVDGSHNKLNFAGKASIQLVYQWDFWCVDSLVLPQSNVL